MAIGIGQQIKGMVNRARNYWSKLTDGSAHRGQSGRDDIDEAVHQRYGGARETEAETRVPQRQASSADRGMADSTRASPSPSAARSDQRSQPGGQPPGSGQGRASQQMQADSQTRRQYTQQGGSGIQKPLDEQMGSSDGKSGAGRPGRPSSGQRQ